MADSTDDLMFGIKKHWNVFFGKDYTMAVCFFGGKTIIASVSGENRTVQIIGPNNEAYVMRLEDGEVVEQCYKDNVKVEKLSIDLKAYKGVLRTLPEAIKEALEPLV